MSFHWSVKKHIAFLGKLIRINTLSQNNSHLPLPRPEAPHFIRRTQFISGRGDWRPLNCGRNRLLSPSAIPIQAYSTHELKSCFPIDAGRLRSRAVKTAFFANFSMQNKFLFINLWQHRKLPISQWKKHRSKKLHKYRKDLFVDIRFHSHKLFRTGPRRAEIFPQFT